MPLLFLYPLKISENLIFTLRYGASKYFMKAFKAFVKPFEAPQRSVKIKRFPDVFKGHRKRRLMESGND